MVRNSKKYKNFVAIHGVKPNFQVRRFPWTYAFGIGFARLLFLLHYAEDRPSPAMWRFGCPLLS